MISCVEQVSETDLVGEYLMLYDDAPLDSTGSFDPTDESVVNAVDGVEPEIPQGHKVFEWTPESEDRFGMMEFSAVTQHRPLLVLFHGYAACHIVQQFYFQLGIIARIFDINLVAVSGEKNSYGKRFWNASDACCDVDGENPNHKERLIKVIRALKKKYSAPEVILWGHSNGGFLAYELACETRGLVDGVFSLGGLQKKGFKCERQEPLKVVHVHGTDDETVSYYEGHRVTLEGREFAVHNSVAESFETFSRQNGCRGERQYVKHFPPFRYKTVIKEGLECEAGSVNQTITIPGGRHIPLFVPPSLWRQALETLLEESRV